jgi:hypothetical protein
LKKFIFIFLLISFNLYSLDIVSSFNNFIKFDLKFTQDTNNGVSSTQSFGQIYRKENVIEIKVDSPSKEKYVIGSSYIEIFDYDFNQTQRLELNNKDSSFIKLLTEGIDDIYVKNITKDSFVYKKNDKKFYIKMHNESEFIVSFFDNMEYENSILFERIN